MGKILHLSDFHLGKNRELEQEKLNKLAVFLKNQDIEYLVYTGDIIDANLIVLKCYQKMAREYPKKYGWYCEGKSEAGDVTSQKNKRDKLEKQILEEGDADYFNGLVKDATIKSMQEAYILIDKFIKDVGSVVSEKVIFCCGNHDRLRRISAEKNITICVQRGGNGDEDVFEEDFDPYNVFCRNMKFDFDYHTRNYRTGDWNFIIANSNWRIPEHGETNKMCINCSLLNNLLSELRNTVGYNKNHTILIWHKPMDDICENIKYSYDGKWYTFKEILEMSVTAFLYGDKHSSDIEIGTSMKKFMCGAPLSTSYIDYNLLEIDRDEKIIARYISWNEESKGWKFRPINECVREIYEVSQGYLKEKLLKYLHVNNVVPQDWKAAIDLIKEDENRLGVLSDLFKSCARIGDKNQKRLELEGNLFDIFTSLLLKEGGRKPINIKGNKGTGKSSFLTIEYIYLLEKFKNGEIQYMPFYFNFEGIMDSLNVEKNNQLDVNEIMNLQFEKFNQYLNECVQLNGKYKIPICILIDGLEQRNLLVYNTGRTLESRILGRLESIQEIEKYVMCFNSWDFPAFGFSFQDVNTFDYVLYMNDVDVVPYKQGWESYKNLTEAYLKISKGEKDLSLEEYLENLLKLHKNSINMKFLAENDNFIRSIQKNIASDEVQNMYVGQLEEKINKLFRLDKYTANKYNSIAKAAYLVGVRGKCFQEIYENYRNLITYEEYVNIRDGKDICEYLISKHYINELSVYASSEEKIAEDSILKCFISRNIAVFIRTNLKFQVDSNKGMITQFMEKHHMETEGYLCSMMFYLLSYSDGKIPDLGILKKEDICKNEKKRFEDYCVLRSFDIANIVRNDRTEDKIEFLDKLLSDEEYRKFNREFQLYYYEDIKTNYGYDPGKERKESHYRKGFDFHNCFLVLFSKLRCNLDIKKQYPLMEVDLFTLCDLVYSRLQLPTDLHLEYKDMFFYGEDYNGKRNSLCSNVLEIVVELLKDYMYREAQYTGGYKEDTPFMVYFRYMKKLFENIKQELEKQREVTVNVPYVSYAECYKHILELENMKRVGWKIQKAGTIRQRELEKLNMKQLNGGETIMQSIIESVYIAQMFLPEDLSEDPNYDKSVVISLLLMSELGKYGTKDYVPQTEYTLKENLKNTEKEVRDSFLILGALDGYANNLKLMKFLSDDTNINLRICHEIQRIQMEYKYYKLYFQVRFKSDRQKEFQNDFSRSYTTDICNNIREKLILNNPDFANIIHR